MMSDSESDPETKAKKVVKKLPSSKVITKINSKGAGASRKDMHGATVVPIAAHLKYKKLLEKK